MALKSFKSFYTILLNNNNFQIWILLKYKIKLLQSIWHSAFRFKIHLKKVEKHLLKYFYFFSGIMYKINHFNKKHLFYRFKKKLKTNQLKKNPPSWNRWRWDPRRGRYQPLRTGLQLSNQGKPPLIMTSATQTRCSGTQWWRGTTIMRFDFLFGGIENKILY